MKEYAPTRAVLLDIDGTLLDSNHAHAASWEETLRQHDRPIAYDRIRALIGKGSDKLLAELLGEDPDSAFAEHLVDFRRRLFLEQYLPTLGPTPGARVLLELLRAEGLELIVASAAGGAELQAMLEQAGVADVLERFVTSDDVDRSKPDPDPILAAVAKCRVAPVEAIMLGDTPYDIEAARRAGVDTIAVRSGGWWNDATLAGAVAIYDSPQALVDQWQQSPIARRRIPAG